jgi:hypothetical protein
MPKKVRTEDDWQELGALLYETHNSLVSAQVKVGRMFGSTRKEAREIERVLASVDELRSRLDSRYYAEAVERNTPIALRTNPIYRGNRAWETA